MDSRENMDRTEGKDKRGGYGKNEREWRFIVLYNLQMCLPSSNNKVDYDIFNINSSFPGVS